MKVSKTPLDGVLLVEPTVFGDARGFFFESWNQERYREHGVAGAFVQDNISKSERGTLRGLHLQNPHRQGKLVSVLDGEVFDVAVDVRTGSPTFGRHVAELISSENKRQLWIPPGFAHGFCVTSVTAIFYYKCTDSYHPESELGIAWDDPDLAIDWPIREPRLSDKDKRNARLAEIAHERLPCYGAT